MGPYDGCVLHGLWIVSLSLACSGKSGMWYSTLLVVVVVILLVTSPAVVSLVGPLCYSYPV